MYLARSESQRALDNAMDNYWKPSALITQGICMYTHVSIKKARDVEATEGGIASCETAYLLTAYFVRLPINLFEKSKLLIHV